MIARIIILICILLFSACAEINESNERMVRVNKAEDGNAIVEFYNGGIKVRSWKVDGYVKTYNHNYCDFFAKDGTYVRIQNNVVVEYK